METDAPSAKLLSVFGFSLLVLHTHTHKRAKLHPTHDLKAHIGVVHTRFDMSATGKLPHSNIAHRRICEIEGNKWSLRGQTHTHTVTWESKIGESHGRGIESELMRCRRVAMQTAGRSSPNLLSVGSGSHTGSVTKEGGGRILHCSYVVTCTSLAAPPHPSGVVPQSGAL